MDRLFVSGELSFDAMAVHKTESMHGRTYTVLPAVMMVEGAYYPNVSGSSEPQALYFSHDTMRDSVRSWNGRPVALNHPEGNVSCNTPEVMKEQWLGFVFDTKYDSGQKRLTCSIWLDQERSSDIIKRTKSGGNIDVSIGAFGDILKEDGVINGVSYNAKIENIIGDHLAILPDSKGACSWTDGCGIRAEDSRINEEVIKKNEKDKGIDMEEQEKVIEEKEEIKEPAPCTEVNATAKEVKKSVSWSEYIDNAPAEIREVLTDQRETYLALKNGYISDILEFKDVQFDESFLGSLKRCQLEKIASLVNIAKGKKVDKTSLTANYGVTMSTNKPEAKTSYASISRIDFGT